MNSTIDFSYIVWSPSTFTHKKYTLTHYQKQALHDIYNLYKLIFINVLNIKVVNELNPKPSP